MKKTRKSNNKKKAFMTRNNQMKINNQFLSK